MNPQDPLQPQMPPVQPGMPAVPQPAAVQPQQAVPTVTPQQEQPQMPTPQPVYAQPPVAPQPFAPAPQPALFQPVAPQSPIGGQFQPQTGAMPPQFPQPPMYQPANSGGSKKKLAGILGGALTALLVLGLGGFQVYAALSGGLPKYKDLVTYTNSKADDGSKFSIKHAPQFEVKGEFATDVSLEHKLPEDKQPKDGRHMISQITVRTSYVPEDAIKEINTQLGNKDSEVYKLVMESLEDPVDGIKGATFGEFRPYTNASIKNGYILDFTAKDGEVEAKGQYIIGLGKERIYEAVLFSLSDVWDKNEQAWKEIADSFAIDL